MVALLIFIDVVQLVNPQHFEHCTVMTRIVVDKSTDHAKPHFDLLILDLGQTKYFKLLRWPNYQGNHKQKLLSLKLSIAQKLVSFPKN